MGGEEIGCDRTRENQNDKLVFILDFFIFIQHSFLFYALPFSIIL